MPTVPVTAFMQAMRDYHLAAAEWLGLDAEKVWDVSVDRGLSPTLTDSGRLPTVTWRSIDQSEPTRGRVAPWGAEGDVDGMRFLGSVALGAHEAEAFLDHIGPEPEQFTPAERAQLARLRDRA